MTATVEHRFGQYGGQYVPETLMPALAELERAWRATRADPLLSRGARRPAAGLRGTSHAAVPRAQALRARWAAGVSQARGSQPHRLAQAQQRARPGAVGQAHGQDAGSSPRPGAGQHGVATATVCALLDLECVVYMGERGHAPPAPERATHAAARGERAAGGAPGARTLKEATSAAIRDWVENVGDTHYVIGSAVGPAPYPALVRDLQRVIGDEARAQILEREGRLPSRVIACVGGGSNAIGTFTAFLDDRAGAADRRGGRRRGHRHASPRRSADGRRARGGAARFALGGHAGRGGPDRRSAFDLRGSRLPGHRAPSTRSCATRAARAMSR